VRILVCPPTLGIGGSQHNAIDLGGAVRDRGHEVAMLAPPGPLEGVARERGLRLIPLALQGRHRPAFVAMQALRRVIREQGIDVVHAYESAPGLEAFFGGGSVGVPIVVSVMSMTVPRRFPRSVPLIVGTRLLEQECSRRGHRTLILLEPPVDTEADEPSFDGSAFRREHGFADEEFAIVAVSRLARSLKLEGLEMAIDAMSALDHAPARLVIVGGGVESDRLATRAAELNKRLGRCAVILTGPTTDPRPAYAAADVVLGMGGSILRGMAFGKPSVVLGGAGFWRVVAPDTIEHFLHEGFYGLGDGADPAGLAAGLRELVLDESRRQVLGAFSRKVVCDRFSLPVAATSLEEFYRRVLEAPRRRHIVELARTGAWVAGIKAKQRLSREGSA